MTEQEKPKITISFTERRRDLRLDQLKKLGKFYLILVIAIAASEAILDFTGIVPFGFPEALIDFFVLVSSFIALGFFTVPIMRTRTYRKRSMAMLKVGVFLVSLQIVALTIFYFVFPGLGSVTYFEVFAISEIAYQFAFIFITRRYKFARKFFSVQIRDGIRMNKGADGYVESVERTDFMTDDLRRTIEDKIKGKISEEVFLSAISGMEPSKRELIISMTGGIESRLRKKYRW